MHDASLGEESCRTTRAQLVPLEIGKALGIYCKESLSPWLVP